MTRVPRADGALLDPRKGSGYLLSDTHPDGRDKAAFFRRFGFSPDPPACLIEALRTHVMEREIVTTRPTEFGLRYVVACSIRSPDGRNPCIVSVWQEDPAGRRAFITAYPR